MADKDHSSSSLLKTEIYIKTVYVFNYSLTDNTVTIHTKANQVLLCTEITEIHMNRKIYCVAKCRV